MCPPPSVARRALLGKPHTSYSLCARCSCSLTAGRGTCPTPECTDDDAAVEIMELRVRRSKCFLDAIAGGCRCPCKSAVCQARHECRLVGTRDGRAEAQPHYNVTDLEFAERLWKGFELWRHFPGSSAEELLSTALKEGWAVCTHARNVVREVKLAINVQNRIGRWNAAEEKLQIEMEKEKKRKAAELGDKVCAVCAKNEGQLSRRRLTLGEYRGWLCCSDRECRKAVRIMQQRARTARQQADAARRERDEGPARGGPAAAQASRAGEEQRSACLEGCVVAIRRFVLALFTRSDLRTVTCAHHEPG